MIAMAGCFQCETGIDILIESPLLRWGLVSGALPPKHLLVLSRVIKSVQLYKFTVSQSLLKK